MSNAAAGHSCVARGRARGAARGRRAAGCEGGPSPASVTVLAAFREALRRHGYADAEIELRYAEGDPQRLLQATQELVRMKVDVIWTAGSGATQAVKDATTTIPVVMVSADAPKQGLVTNLARPEANLTGLSLVGTEIVVKRIEMLKEIAPKTVRLIAVVPGPGAIQYPIVADWLRHSEKAARALKLGFRFAELTPDPAQWDDLFAGFAATPGNALSVIGEPVLPGPQQTPGAAVAAEQPTKYEIVVNAATAKTLSLTIPRSVLLRVDEVIE